MKKIAAAVLAALMLFSFLALFSCSKKDEQKKPDESAQPGQDTIQKISLGVKTGVGSMSRCGSDR